MASVNFSNGKLKGATHAKAVFAHCEKEERLKREHSNAQINKDETSKNTTIKGLTYAELCQAYDDRIKEIDESGQNTNVRKDRVTCFGLNIPVPEDLEEAQEDKWFGRVTDILVAKYGDKNFLDGFVHRDEKHEYKAYALDEAGNVMKDEDGKVETEERTSRTHGHYFFIPEHEGGLNGKWFSNKRNMTEINKQIHEMSEAEFGCQFMDGTKIKNGKKVEQLKFESRRLELDERQEDIQAERERFERYMQGERKKLDAREAALDEREARTKAEWKKVSKERAENMMTKQMLENEREAVRKQGIEAQAERRFYAGVAQEHMDAINLLSLKDPRKKKEVKKHNDITRRVREGVKVNTTTKADSQDEYGF